MQFDLIPDSTRPAEPGPDESLLQQLEQRLGAALDELARLRAENAQLRTRSVGMEPSGRSSDATDVDNKGNETLSKQETAINQKNESADEQASKGGASSRKAKNRSANRAAIDLLKTHYPQAFGQEVRPLKIGIQEDLLEDGKIAKGKIKRALASYVRSIAYYKSLQAGAVRIDLQGQPAGEVSEQEAEYARGKIKQWRKERQEREKQARVQAKQERMQDKLQQLVGRHNA